jgi:signal transduction histidine kinase
MPLKVPKLFWNSLAVRLTLWYSAVLIFSFLILSIVSYLFVFSAIRDNRRAIKTEMAKYVELEKNGEIEAIRSSSLGRAKPSRRNSFFVRIVDSENKTEFLSNPWLWEQFDLTRPQDQLLDGQWHYYTSRRDGDLLEVLSARVADGKLLQVGKSIQDRGDVIEHFRDTLLATIIPMVLVGFAGGAWLADRALRPIRKLSVVARSIVDTGRFDARVSVRARRNELDELAVLFNQMLEKIEILIRSMKDSLDNVAHDLRTPVTRLRGMAEQALRSESCGTAAREALADCLEESERLMATLNALMDVSEAEAGAMKLSLESLDLGALIGEVAELYGYAAEEKNITLSTNAAKGIYVDGDETRLRQVIANLVDNAVKYTPKGGRIDIETREEDRQALVVVKDNGIGIPPEEIGRIWDRLYRGDKSRSQRGLGLGLSLVKAVIQAHNGRVEAAPNPGGGSVFSVYLPPASGS